MSRSRECAECGAEIDAAAIGGLCPRCLLKLGELSNLDIVESSPEGPVRSDDAPGEILGRYRLLEKLGEGGFGTVWKAEQTAPVRRIVELKVIKLGMDTREVIARFQAESQALALMDHPGIAKVLDAGSSPGGRPFFVMELVEGVPITRYCKEQGLDLKARLHLFLDVCAAVQHAHQKGIIHRDLKPSNILVGQPKAPAGDPVLKVIDFGIAKAIEGELTDHTMMTREGQFVGTPVYMSPEQAGAQGVDVDTRSDIYTLGVVLYEMLAGVPPFDARSLLSAGYEEMCRIIREADPPKPSTRLQSTLHASPSNPSGPHDYRALRGDLDWIVMKALEKERARRYETANGLANDIERFLADEPVTAHPPSVAYRFRKAWRRNRAAFTSGAVVFLSLTVGIAVSLWQAVEATRANQRLHRQVAATETAKRKAEELLERIQLQRAEESFRRQEPGLGVVYLGQVLRANPANHIAATRLVSALMRPFCTPLTEPLRHEEWVRSAQFSPDGLRVVTASQDKTARVWVVTASGGTARVWDVFSAETPVPSWFLDWAEARVNRRVSDPDPSGGAIIPQMERRQLQESVAAREGADFYSGIAKWSQADPATRTISPHSTITVLEFVRRRIEENTLASLRDSVQLSPSNSLAWARLALAEADQDSDEQPGRLVKADFSARLALRLDATNGEAWRALATVQFSAGQIAEASLSAQRALELQPDNRVTWELSGDVLAPGSSARPRHSMPSCAQIPRNPEQAFLPLRRARISCRSVWACWRR